MNEEQVSAENALRTSGPSSSEDAGCAETRDHPMAVGDLCVFASEYEEEHAKLEELRPRMAKFRVVWSVRRLGVKCPTRSVVT